VAHLHGRPPAGARARGGGRGRRRWSRRGRGTGGPPARGHPGVLGARDRPRDCGRAGAGRRPIAGACARRPCAVRRGPRAAERDRLGPGAGVAVAHAGDRGAQPARRLVRRSRAPHRRGPVATARAAGGPRPADGSRRWCRRHVRRRGDAPGRGERRAPGPPGDDAAPRRRRGASGCGGRRPPADRRRGRRRGLLASQSPDLPARGTLAGLVGRRHLRASADLGRGPDGRRDGPRRRGGRRVPQPAGGVRLGARARRATARARHRVGPRRRGRGHRRRRGRDRGPARRGRALPRGRSLRDRGARRGAGLAAGGARQDTRDRTRALAGVRLAEARLERTLGR